MATPTGSTSAVPWHRDPTLRSLVVASLLNSIAFFATLPFLTLYLANISDLGEAAIGAVVGATALIGAFGGFFGGMLTDRFGAVALIRAGVLVYISTYALLVVSRQTGLVIGLVLVLGVGRLLVEPSLKKLMSLADTRESGGVFRIRYVTLCVGAIIGPPIGATLFAMSDWLIFVLPTVVFGGFLWVVAHHRPRLAALDEPGEREARQWREGVTDRRLMIVIAAGFVMFVFFSQFETILPLFIRSELGPATAAAYFSVMLASNAALGIVFQPPAIWLSKRISQTSMALIGCLGFASSMAFFALLPVHIAFPFVGVVLWTVGEAILVPLPDVLIHQITPPRRKGTYFGLAELRYVGFFLGPTLGGALLGRGATWYFAALAGVILCVWPLLWRRWVEQPPVAAPAEGAAATLPAKEGS